MKFYLSILLCLTAFTQGICNATRDAFLQFKNHYFVESGTYAGDGIKMALDAGFQEIFSIEILPQYYKNCITKFANYNNVHLILGDSVKIFPEILKKIDAPATFWLDAHFCSYDGKRQREGYIAKTTSLEEELLAIRNHPIKEHTILIDDVRLFDTAHMERISLKKVKDLLRSINPDYRIFFIDGSYPNDILVATP